MNHFVKGENAVSPFVCRMGKGGGNSEDPLAFF